MTEAENADKPVNPKLLIVDDEIHVRAFYEKLLGKEYEIRQAGDGHEALEVFSEFHPDVVILDIGMPGLSGIEVCRQLRERTKDGPYVAILFLTGRNDPKQLTEGLAAGADDYCHKPASSTELKARIKANLRIKDITDRLRNTAAELEVANKKLEQLSITDELTGLYNMRYFNGRVTEEFIRAERYEHPLSLIMMDLDRFKQVNDGCNHLMGSYVIAEVGRRIRDQIREVDIAARYGGDEYILLLPVTDKTGARIAAERIATAVGSEGYTNDGFTVSLTASIGVATFHGNKDEIPTATKLIQRADEMLYKAKENGRNRVVDCTDKL